MNFGLKGVELALKEAHFTQYTSLFHYILNIFASLKRNNFLRKTDQCECGFSILGQ